MNILIIGGSRFMGPLLVRELSSRGHTVTVFNRGTRKVSLPQGVIAVVGDRTQEFSLPGNFDVVIDTCAYKPEDITRVFEGVHFDYYLHIGTAASYKKSHLFPLIEESPLGEWPLWGNYNLGKVACEEYLKQSGKKYGVIRPVYILGKNNHVPRESFIYTALRRGDTIRVPGNGLALIQFVYVEDVVSSIVRVAEAKATGAYNCCGPDVVTLRGLVEEMATIAGLKLTMEDNPNTDGTHHDGKEFPFGNEHFFCTNNKLKMLGVEFTPLLEGLKRDYAEYYEAITRSEYS